MKILNCSSRGDKRFSAFYARVSVFSKIDSIENHFQLSKRINGRPAPTTWRDMKGKRPDYFVVGQHRIPAELLSAWYALLWVKYLDAHPELVQYAKGFDSFYDPFAKPGRNNQAEVIRAYVKDGRNAIMHRADVVKLLHMLK